MMRTHGLSERQRFCVRIAVSATLGRRRSLEASMRQAVSRKIPRRFLEELCLHLSLILGFPVMLDALERLDRVSPVRVAGRRARMRPANGRVMLQKIYGRQTDKLLENLHRLHPEIEMWIIRDVYGRVFARPGLSLKERELLNVVVLSLQGLNRQLYSHVRGALRNGFSPSELRRCLTLLERVSGRSATHARAFLREVVSQKKMS